MPRPRLDVIGDRYGRLMIMDEVEDAVSSSGQHRRRVLCWCECGGVRIAELRRIKDGTHRCCGCSTRNHGGANSPEYTVWSQMKQRCTNPKNSAYRNYGGRGITVCDAWIHSFAAFYKAVGPRPGPAYTLDRIDNGGDYEPGNVRWATRREQANNLRTNHLLSHRGRTQTISAWARELGFKRPQVLARRLQLGWSVESALTTPLREVE